MDTISPWTGGAPVAGRSGRFSPVHDPATGQQIAEVALASAAEVDDVVKVAVEAAAGWYGPEGIRFYTRPKVVTRRWPDPATSAIDLGFPTND